MRQNKKINRNTKQKYTQTNCNEEIKVVHKTGENNNDKDRIKLDVKRNTKESIENDKTNDDNDIVAENQDSFCLYKHCKEIRQIALIMRYF